MNILAPLIRRVRLARLRDTAYRLAYVRQAYREQVLGLARDLDRLERAHLRDITQRGPSARDIARGVERKAKANLWSAA